MAFEHFGLLAPFYDRLIRLGETEALIRRFGLPITGRLLDVGGGTGRVSAGLNGMSGQVIVVDISIGMLRQAQRKELSVVNAPAEDLPFPDEVFERVLMVDSLHHVVDQSTVASELWRVLTPGGRLLIVEPDIRRWIVKGIALFEKIAFFRSHFLSPPEIIRLYADYETNPRVELDSSTAWVIVEKTGC